MKQLVLLASPLLLLAVRPADACSPPLCWPGAFVPAEGATVPASAGALYWRPLAGNVDVDPAAVRLVTTAAPSTPLAITATPLPDGDYLIVPTAPLVAGTEYQLVDDTQCSGPGGLAGPQTTFTATAAAPLPTTLGSLSATTPARSMLTVATASGSCSTEVDAVTALVTLTLDAGAAPWRDLLHYQTYVDNAPWATSNSILASTDPGASWVGRGSDGIYHVCATTDPSASRGVAEGEHVVRMEATLPGTSVVLASSTVTINLSCETTDTDGPTDPEDPGDAPRGPDGDDAGGCATSGGAGLLVAVGAIALGRRRRRR